MVDMNKKNLMFALAAVAIFSVAAVAVLAATAASPASLSETTTFATAQAPSAELTGDMSVYIVPISSGYHNAAAVVKYIGASIQNHEAAQYYENLGASVKGQYSYENVLLTEQNITPELKAEGFDVGDTVLMRVYKKPASSINFYIDPAVRRPDGKSVTVADIPEDYAFGNGISCCGFSLKDGTDVSAAIIVVDKAHESIVNSKLATLKTEINAK